MPISQRLLTDGGSVVVDTRTHPEKLFVPTHGSVQLRDIPDLEKTQRTLSDLLGAIHGGGRADDGA